MLTASMCYGQESDRTVRIRVRTPRLFNEQVILDGYGSITVYENVDGELEELFQTENSLNILMDYYYDKNYNFMSSGFNNARMGPYHVKLKGKEFASYEDAMDEIRDIEQTAGSGFYPYYNGTGYEICIGAYTDESSASLVFPKLNQNGLDGQIVNGSKKNAVVYNSENVIVFMYKNNYNIYFSSYNEQLSCDMVKIDKKPYRGMFALNIINDTTLISINRVDVESYLYGVVPSESSASWPMDALKAQTLTARTYALANLKPNAYYGYDMEDNTYDQVYGGYISEHEATNRAVDETKGEMIYYDGKLIDAVFHSTSGGSTENSENIWTNSVPYLRGVQDEYSNVSPITQWSVVYTKKDIIERLNLYENNVSELYGIELTKISENNRVLECIFNTDKGKITYTKDTIRSVLGLKSQWFTIGGAVASGTSKSDFYFIDGSGFNGEDNHSGKGGILDDITDASDSDNSEKQLYGSLDNKYVISSSKTSDVNAEDAAFISSSGVSSVQTALKSNPVNSSGSSYTINGRGWGHGVGMSQYGAMQMAKEGFTYKEIIKHYYTGVSIK